jgi:hypothetical protein
MCQFVHDTLMRICDRLQRICKLQSVDVFASVAHLSHITKHNFKKISTLSEFRSSSCAVKRHRSCNPDRSSYSWTSNFFFLNCRHHSSVSIVQHKNAHVNHFFLFPFYMFFKLIIITIFKPQREGFRYQWSHASIY